MIGLSDVLSFERIWQRFAGSKKFRENFVAAYAKRSIPLQIRRLMKKRQLSQGKLAEQSELTQGVISRATDLNYGNLTLNTIIRVGGGLDCVFVGRYIPYSEFVKTIVNGPDKAFPDVPGFQEENENIREIIETLYVEELKNAADITVDVPKKQPKGDTNIPSPSELAATGTIPPPKQTRTGELQEWVTKETNLNHWRTA